MWIKEMKRMKIKGRLKAFLQHSSKLAHVKSGVIVKQAPCSRENKIREGNK